MGIKGILFVILWTLALATVRAELGEPDSECTGE